MAALVSLLLLAALAQSAASAATPTKTDVTFVFDTSGSMGGVLDEAKAEIQDVMGQLQDALPDVQFGLAEVRDYPFGEYGQLTDAPWRLDVPVTGNVSQVSEAVSGLYAAGGGDSPEAYGRALWETDTNPTVGWRPGARHLIVLIADEVPHDDNLNEGIPPEFWLEESPWSTGEELPGNWEIPGTQLGALSGLDFQSILHSLASDEKPLEMVDYIATGADYIHYWEYWAGLAGGTALEAATGGTPLASALTELVERSAVPCATTANAAPVSSATPGTIPAVATARFLQPASQVILTPVGATGFCKGQLPILGTSVTSALEEASSSRIVFRVPGGASNGFALTGRTGAPGPQQAYGVDNFRYPWGFQIENSKGDGGHQNYDVKIGVTQQDLDSVFADVGPPGSFSNSWAKYEAEAILGDGLCYGFSLLSRSLYDDAHGAHDPLSFADSPGFALHAGSVPYTLTESAGGSHPLTHALLRAAISQISPEERASWNGVTSAATAEAQLNAAFRLGRPALLNFWFDLGGHTVLAFNYQRTATGIAVDVVDPNVPWSAGQPANYFDSLQVDINGNGSWSYNGSFTLGSPFSHPINGAAGNISIVPAPPSPGSLKLWTNGRPPGIQITPGRGTSTTAISYSRRPGHGLPPDVHEARLFADAPTGSLVVPEGHRLVTITQSSHGHPHGPTFIVGGAFLDAARSTRTNAHETIQTDDGALSMPNAHRGDMLSVTNIVGGVKRAATVTFTGNAQKPSLTVTPGGDVTLQTAGGNGSASIRLATYTRGGTSSLRPERVVLHGRARVHRHTPKPKRRKRHGRGVHKRR